MLSNLADRLKSLRDERGITQQKLADFLKVSRSAIASYETNRKEPDNTKLLKLAEFYDVSVDYLLGRTNERKTALSIKETLNFIDEYIAEMEKSGFDMTGKTKDEVANEILENMKLLNLIKRNNNT